MEKEIRFCKGCKAETEHTGVIAKAQHPDDKTKKEKAKELISAIVAG